MYKRQHYALEHSERDSASSNSSSSLDTASDADSGGPELSDDAAWPASSRESDDSLQEEESLEVDSSASVAERRANALLIAERKLAEAAEDFGEFQENGGVGSEPYGIPREETVGSDCDKSEVNKGTRTINDNNETSLHEAHTDSESSDVEHNELLAQRRDSNQWAEAVDEEDSARRLGRFESSSVLCVGGDDKVFRCRVCPKIICLNEETMQAHLTSKRHSRSMKQLAEGKLKIQLDSDGEECEDGETHAERYARTVAAAQEVKEPSKQTKRGSGRQRQRRREKIKKRRLQLMSRVSSG